MDEKEKNLIEPSADELLDSFENIISEETASEEISISDDAEAPTNIETAEVTEAEGEISSETAEAEGEISSETAEAEGETTSETAEAAVPEKKISLKEKAAEFLERIGIPDVLLSRLITVFFLISGMNLAEIMTEGSSVKSAAIEKWKEYIPQISFPLTLVLMASVFVFMSLIHYAAPKKLRVFDQLGAVGAVIYFDLLILWRSSDFYLSLGTMIVSSVLIYYSINKLKSQKLFNKIPWWIWGLLVLAAAAGVVVFVSITTICTHRSFGTACHDFGLFVQMYHSLIDDGTAITTCEREYTISHFKIHASYIFYALVPVFKMFPKAETLLVAQAVMAMGGVVPMLLIAKRHNFKGLSLFFMGLAYVFCVGIVAPCYYEFHENAFLPTILMWLLWAVDRKNYIMFYIMSVLTCIVKEDAPLYVVCIGLYLFFEDKGNIRRMNGLIMALFAGAYMLFITNWLTENGDGQMMMGSRFGILMIDSSGGLTEVVKNAFLDPAYLLSLLIKEGSLRFFLQIMAPMLFIPFFTKKIRRFMLMVPFIVMNLVIGAGYVYAADVGFQYIFGPVCLILYMCVINVDDMGQRGKQTIPVVLGAAALIMTFSNSSHKWNNYRNYHSDKGYFDSLEVMLDTIPKDASVGTDTFIIPHVADHDEIYIFDGNDINEDGTIKDVEKYDYMAIPVRSDMFEKYENSLLKSGYTLWAEIEGKFNIYVSPNYN
ncbi:MAG: DUF2079 domain-containing protein [Ruminococcus sp.]|nr:DUF2079 domain-containing protein [Ruminococcus sp.]